MSSRYRWWARWLWPGLCLVFTGAALTILMVKRHAANAQAPRALVVETERPKTPVAAPTPAVQVVTVGAY